MGESNWFTRRERRVATEVICRFTGCDATATATVGTVTLCGLHRSFIENLLDNGVPVQESQPVADPAAD